MLKIGVFGTSQLGQLHYKCLQEIKACDLVGFFDPDEHQTIHIQEKYNIKRFTNFDEFIQAIDVMDVVDYSMTQFNHLVQALRRFKHLFINKFALQDLTDAAYLINLSKEANVQIQIGQSGGFNPAYIKAIPFLDNPLFIESTRTKKYNPKQNVDVVMDLMMKDVEAILNIVKSPIKKVSANGFNIMNDQIDVANARLEFDNGCIANLTSSRIAKFESANSVFLQKNLQICINYLNNQLEVMQMNGKLHPKVLNTYSLNESTKDFDCLKSDLSSFIQAINSDSSPSVEVDDSYHVLKIMSQIRTKINHSANNL